MMYYMKTGEIMNALRKIAGYELSVHELCILQENPRRKHLTEKQLDKMIEDSFPASDAPSTY